MPRTKRSVVVGLVCLGAVGALTSFQQRYGLSALAVADGWPVTVVGRLIGLAGMAGLLLAMVALAGPIARRYGWPRWPAILLATALALVIGPVRTTLGLGHLELILFALITADIVALRRSAWARSRAAWWPGPPASRPARGRSPADLLRRWWATGAWAGIGTGVATAVAISPILFVLHLALTRQWRAALTALATAGTLLAGGLVVAPGIWQEQAAAISAPANQSLAGVLARLYDSAGTPVLVWLSFSVLLVAVGLIRARSAHADGDEVAAFTLVGLTAAAIGPVSETHELIWLLPAMLILLDAAVRRRVTIRPPRPQRFAGLGHAGAAVLIYLLCLADPRWTEPWNAAAFTVIVLLNALPWRAGVAPALPTRPPRPAPRVPAIPGPRGS